MLLSKREEEAIKEFMDSLLSACNGRVRQIRLFGSKARGDCTIASDIDVLVVVDKDDLELWDKIQGISSTTSLKFDLFLSVKVLDIPHFSLLHSLQTGFIKNIEKEGIDILKAA